MKPKHLISIGRKFYQIIINPNLVYVKFQWVNNDAKVNTESEFKPILCICICFAIDTLQLDQTQTETMMLTQTQTPSVNRPQYTCRNMYSTFFEFFTNSPQYNDVNIANFVSAV